MAHPLEDYEASEYRGWFTFNCSECDNEDEVETTVLVNYDGTLYNAEYICTKCSKFNVKDDFANISDYVDPDRFRE